MSFRRERGGVHPLVGSRDGFAGLEGNAVIPRYGRATMSRYRGLYLLFFLSGISGLVYESIWSRYLRLFVGSAATAQILVLSLFMGGMSLGALFAGRIVARIRVPIVAYGIVEGLIGLYALAFPLLQDMTSRLCYDVVFPVLGGGLAVSLVKWGVAVALVLPPCILLGMTFPLMSVGILRRERDRSGEVLSMLYFTNSLGAALGALLSGFLLVGAIGLSKTLLVAGLLNLAIMAAAMRERRADDPIDAGSLVDTAGGLEKRSARRWVVLMLAIAFGTGLSSFMYEVGWIRLLSMVLGSATHSFEAMLSAFVLGLALGGFWVKKRMDRFRRPEVVLAIVQLIMGMSAIATLPLYQVAVHAMSGIASFEQRSELLWLAFNVTRYFMCMLIMLPATFCAGMTLPLLTHVLLRRGQSEAAVGRVYGINTLGAIAGATLAGIVLMPLIGMQRVIVVGALLDLALGLFLLREEIAHEPTQARMVRSLLRRGLVATAMLAVLGLFVVRLDPMVLTSTVFRNGRVRLPDNYEILSYVDGRTASVTVLHDKDQPGYRVIYTNGKPDASAILERWPEDRETKLGPRIAGDEPNQILVGLLPLMARPQAKRAALIGFGSGITCHVLLGSPVLERLDSIEIEPEMFRGAKRFMPLNRRAYDDARNHVWFDDAKAYFAGEAASYDVIVSEPTNPWVSGVSSLFTVEFYREIKRYLVPGGVMAQWLQGYELGDELLLTVLTALDREFTDYQIVRVGERDWMILAVAEGAIGSLHDGPLAWPGMSEELAVLGIHDIGQIDALVVANRRMLHPYLAGRVPNSDEHPVLDTKAEHARFMKLSAEFLHAIRWTPLPMLEALGGIDRRSYPINGIGDSREPHILHESERAVAVLARHRDPQSVAPLEVDASAMNDWLDKSGAVTAGTPDYNAWTTWLHATWRVFEYVEPHVRLNGTPWWADVTHIVATPDIPKSVSLGFELLDAVARRDAVAMSTAAEAVLAREDVALPRQYAAVVGMIALELKGAPQDIRRAYADRYMAIDDVPTTSPDRAFAALRAYLER